MWSQIRVRGSLHGCQPKQDEEVIVQQDGPTGASQSLSPREGISVEQEPGMEWQSLSKLRRAYMEKWSQPGTGSEQSKKGIYARNTDQSEDKL